MSFDLLENDRNYYKRGYAKSNCLVQGFNPDLPAIVASPFVEKNYQNGKKVGMSLYVYQNEIDENGKKWQHQPIRVKVKKLQYGFDVGDKINFVNLECIRIIVQNKNSSSINFYYRADSVQPLKEDDINV